MSTAAATLADLLAHLPTLTRRQVSTIAIADPPPDGGYAITLADASGTSTALDSAAGTVRDELLAGLVLTALATPASLGGAGLTLTGASYGVAFEVGTTAPADGLTLSTISAGGVPEALIGIHLTIAKRLVRSAEIWGDMLATGQALRALHLLARAGILAQHGADYEGEQGQLASSSLGPSSSSFAVAPVPEGSDGDLAATKWGRLYLELWRTIRVRATGQVLR